MTWRPVQAPLDEEAVGQSAIAKLARERAGELVKLAQELEVE